MNKINELDENLKVIIIINDLIIISGLIGNWLSFLVFSRK
jgi:hypothetical protein